MGGNTSYVTYRFVIPKGRIRIFRSYQLLYFQTLIISKSMFMISLKLDIKEITFEIRTPKL